MSTTIEKVALTAKDFANDQDIRWCPGCGDYSILKQVQTILPQVGATIENTVFVSGIGCSSRFPYYMNTYGMHTIHGRATAVASGLKASRPDLDVWIISGDGDSMSIGAGHTLHLLRRNLNVNFLIFNNQIYGLTKGQYSPTSEENKVTKSSPLGSIDHPFNPAALALGADASFVSRSMDRDPKHLQEVLKRAHAHKGTSFVEIYQNCNIFNDGAFEVFTEKGTKKINTIMVEHGKPLLFGENNALGIKLDGFKPVIVNLAERGASENDMWIHDEADLGKASILVRMFDTPGQENFLPRPFGVFYQNNRPVYEDQFHAQIKEAQAKPGDLDKLIAGKETWTVA
jgi:2-oxoglutarate/2-oxoacid ferredoxin oxidoreductase subunit beta